MTQTEYRHLSNRDALRLVGHLIDAQTPTALIRFGEGEARVLDVEHSRPESLNVARHKLAKQTGWIFSPTQISRVKERLTVALMQADIAGLEYSESFSAEHKEWMRKLFAIHGTLAAENSSRAQRISHCMINGDLYRVLPSLLDSVSQLSVVSCRNLKSRLELLGVEDVAVYQVPSQYVMRDIDDEYEAKLHDVPIWPDFYDNLESRIHVRHPGEVFLVGAGIFGKHLCIRIRELGGIALDMGSALDRMAEKITRGPNRPAFRKLPPDPLSV